MGLGRTCRTADTVTAGTAAEENDDVARSRTYTNDILCRSSTYYGTDLHSLRHITRVIDLIHVTCAEADLVTVGAVSCSCCTHQFLLGELTLERHGNRNSRIAGTGHTHSLVYIGTSGERVTDRTAEAGRCTTERLDLGRVVMCLVLKHKNVVFFLSVHIDLDLDGAGIDLFRLIQVSKLAVLLEFSHRHSCHIHEADRLLADTLAVYIFSCREVIRIDAL